MKLRMNGDRRKSDPEVVKKPFAKAYISTGENRITRMIKIMKNNRIDIMTIIYRSKWIAIIIALTGIVLSLYYSYLTSLYLIDEVYDGDALKEFHIEEKLTIIVTAPKNSPEGLKKFVESYSLCQSVHEVVIIWNANNYNNGKIDNNHQDHDEFPNINTYFRFMHTHSKVKFTYTYLPNDIYSSDSSSSSSSGSSSSSSSSSAKTSNRFLAPLSYAQFLYNQHHIETESIMFLDADVVISCDDLAFTLNVWRSANESIVGYFPRNHRVLSSDTISISSSQQQQQQQLAFEGPLSVWHNHKYSIILPAGAIINKNYLWIDADSDSSSASSSTHSSSSSISTVSSSSSSSTTVSSSNDNKVHISTTRVNEELQLLLKVLHEKPECSKMAFSLYAAFQKAAPPVWVDIPLTIDHSILLHPSSSSSSSSLLSVAQETITHSECMNRIAVVLKLNIEKSLPYSYHKASPAKTHLIW